MKHFIHILLCIEPHSCLMHQYLLDNSSHRVSCTTYVRGSSGHSKKLSSETDKITTIHLCLVWFASQLIWVLWLWCLFLRKQHYMHPSNKLPVLCFNRLWRWTKIISSIYGVMAILWSEWITTVIKYKLKLRNRLWNTGDGTQELLQNSSLGKISVSFRVKEK